MPGMRALCRTGKLCPYCDAELPGNTAIKLLKISALILATVGLFLVYLAGRASKPEVISISSITPAMNFARVSVRGIVKQKPHVSQDAEYLSFYIYDGDRRIKVAAYRSVAIKLAESGRLPRNGSRVEAAGELRYNHGDPVLNLASCDALKIQQLKDVRGKP